VGQARVSLGWTQADLAKASGISEVTIARMEIAGVEIVDNEPIDEMTIRFNARTEGRLEAPPEPPAQGEVLE